MSRRACLWAVGLTVSAVAVLFLFRDSSGQQPGRTKNKSEPPKTDVARGDQPVRTEPAQTVGTQQLPIGQVVLFSSGVGYFQREGTVEGNAAR